MIKSLFLCIFIFLSLFAFSQKKPVENVVADTACTCLQKLDINLPKEKLAVQANDCMLQAIKKNNKLIEESYTFREDKAHQDGIQRGQELAKKVFVILVKECDKYKPIFEKLSKK